MRNSKVGTATISINLAFDLMWPRSALSEYYSLFQSLTSWLITSFTRSSATGESTARSILVPMRLSISD